MEPHPSQNQHQVGKPEDLTAIAIRVRTQALADFELWLDGELQQLVARWSHLAAPGAHPSGRRLFPLDLHCDDDTLLEFDE